MRRQRKEREAKEKEMKSTGYSIKGKVTKK